MQLYVRSKFRKNKCFQALQTCRASMSATTGSGRWLGWDQLKRSHLGARSGCRRGCLFGPLAANASFGVIAYWVPAAQTDLQWHSPSQKRQKSVSLLLIHKADTTSSPDNALRKSHHHHPNTLHDASPSPRPPRSLPPARPHHPAGEARSWPGLAYPTPPSAGAVQLLSPPA